MQKFFERTPLFIGAEININTNTSGENQHVYNLTIEVEEEVIKLEKEIVYKVDFCPFRAGRKNCKNLNYYKHKS